MTSVAAAMRKAMNHSSRWSSAFRNMAAGRVRSIQVRSQLVRVEPGFLVDRLDEVLAHARLVLLVHLDERVLPRLLLFGRERDDLRLAAFAHRIERFVVLA